MKQNETNYKDELNKAKLDYESLLRSICSREHKTKELVEKQSQKIQKSQDESTKKKLMIDEQVKETFKLTLFLIKLPSRKRNQTEMNPFFTVEHST